LTLEQRGFQLGFGPAPPLPLQKLCWLCEDGPCDTGTWFRLYGDGMMFCKACVCMSCFAPSPGSDPAQSAWEDQIAHRCKVKAVENFDLAAVSQEFLQQPGERNSLAKRNLDDDASSDVEVVEVYFVAGREIDSRIGLPWGMSQAAFDALNDAYRLEKTTLT
jgi:hypothetical protein